MVVCAACGAENRLDAAERALRGGYDRLGDYGETGFRSTTGTLLADVLARLGRFDEADELLDEVAGVMTADDVDPQVRLRAVRGQILARRGELAAAERSAREAVALAARTDYLVSTETR